MIGSLSEAVQVIGYTSSTVDALGNDVKVADGPLTVQGVLVVPGAQAEPGGDNRPDGEEIAYTLYFPKSFKGNLDGCDVVVRGERCRVKGHPDRYRVYEFMDYDMKCEVSRVEG